MVHAIAYAPDGQSLAVQVLDAGDPFVSGKPRRIFPHTSLYDPRSGREIGRFEGEGTASRLVFSPDGKVLAGAIESGAKEGITLWDVASGCVVRTMGGPFAGTMALAFLPDGRVVVSCASWPAAEQVDNARRSRKPEESATTLWDVASGHEIRRIGIGKTTTIQAVLAPDGNTLATGTTDKTIRVWDLATGRELRRLGAGDMEAHDIAFSPDGAKLAATESRGNSFENIMQDVSKTPPLHASIRVWETATGRELN